MLYLVLNPFQACLTCLVISLTKFESLRVLPFSVWCVVSIRNYRLSARAEGTIADDVRLFLTKYDSTFFVVVRGPTIFVG